MASPPLAPHAGFEDGYRDLRALAAAYLRRFPNLPSLQATALVHEAYLKLARDSRDYADRAHFVRTAAAAMRQILVDQARARQRFKRGGELLRVTLDGLDFAQPQGVDVLILDDALQRLQSCDPRQAQIVELRCFIGFSVSEAAEVMQVSEKTVKRDWAMARAWLRRELAPPARSGL